jgi:hypothetical protein
MKVEWIQEPNRTRNKGIYKFLRNDDWRLMIFPYMPQYQALIYFDRIIFSSPTKTGRVFDRYKVNNKTREIRSEMIKIGLPENTLLIGGFYHSNPDLMAGFFKGGSGLAFNIKFKHTIEYIVYDIAQYNGISLVNESFDNRREILEKIFDGEKTQYLRLLDIYTGEEKKQIYEDNKGAFNLYHKDHPLKGIYYRHNDFQIFHVVIMKANFKGRDLVSFTIGQFKGRDLVEVGHVTNLSRMYIERDDPALYEGNIATVASRAVGKKLLNPKLVDILYDENDFRKCKYKNKNLK